MIPEQTSGDGSGGTELGRFLRAGRGRVTAAEVGLPTGTGLRRTPGLRREELATLAGISIDYYARLERGSETHPSPSVIDALARVLLLEEAEHEHLRSLAALAAGTAPKPPTAPSRTVPPGARLLLDRLRPHPAQVLSRTGDLLAHNPGGLGMFPGMAEWPANRRNIARYAFLHPAARELFGSWDTQVRGCVAFLRAAAGTSPDAPDLAELVGELLLKSPEFARLWDRYDVRGSAYGRKTLQHPEVGALTPGHQSMQLSGTPGQQLVVHFAEPGTPEYDAITLLDIVASGHESRPKVTAPAAPHPDAN